jgi:hypothetical protein
MNARKFGMAAEKFGIHFGPPDIDDGKFCKDARQLGSNAELFRKGNKWKLLDRYY